MGLAQIICRECKCGQLYFIMQAGEVADAFSAILKAGVQIEKPPVGFDTFTTGQENAKCSKCGAAIALPVAEALDTDRSDFGRWYECNIGPV